MIRVVWLKRDKMPIPAVLYGLIPGIKFKLLTSSLNNGLSFIREHPGSQMLCH